jgi:hypothetical protein
VLSRTAALLGIALANEEYADEAVQTPIVSASCKYLQQAVLRKSSGGSSDAQQQLLQQQQQSSQQQDPPPASPQQPQQEQQQQQQQQPEQAPGVWDKYKAPAKSALKAAGAHEPGSSQQQQQQQRRPQDEQQPQQQVPELPGNPALSIVARYQDGLVSDDEVMQLRLRKLLSVMRCLTCTGARAQSGVLGWAESGSGVAIA